MSEFHIFYLRGGLLEATDDVASNDLVEVARVASSRHPDLTAEIWLDGKKAAVVRPCHEHHSTLRRRR